MTDKLATSTVNPRSPPTRESFAADRLPAIFGTAWRFRKEAPTGRNVQALSGKHLALLHSKAPEPGPSLLQRAAQDLGARVSHVHLGEPVLPPSGTLGGSIPKVLGRLYDAIDASSLPPAVVRQIALQAGVPVYDGLDRDDHPIHAIAALLALRDHGCEPGSAMPIVLIGHAASAGGTTLMQTATCLGYAVEERVPPGTTPAGVFWVDSAVAPQWALGSPSGVIAPAEHQISHCFALQALLMCTLAER